MLSARPRVRRQRRRLHRAGRHGGAAALLVTLLMGVLASGGMGAADVAAAVAAEGRAENAADAAAHAVAGLLATDPEREHLSLSVQGAAPCGLDDSRAGGSIGAPDNGGAACRRAVAVARLAAAQNGAVLLRLSVGPDPRDLRPDRGPGRLLTLALVAVPRGMPVLPGRCPPSPGTGPDLCWAEAWSAAQEAG